MAPPPPSPHSLLLLRRRSFSFLPLLTPSSSHSFSSSSSSSAVPAETPELPSTKPPPLSARLSFVIDQLDSLDRSRSRSRSESSQLSDLRRIQSWRHSRDQNQQPQHPPPPPPDQTIAREADEAEEISHHHRHAVVLEDKEEESKTSMGEAVRMEVELVHPWPEWIELMERLAQQKYFDLAMVDEDRVAAEVPSDLSEVKEEEEEVAMDFSRDWITVRNACTNFGRDRFDILKYVG